MAAPTGPADLEPSRADLRHLIDRTADRLVDYVGSLPQQPGHDATDPSSLSALVDEPLPEHGAPYDDLLALLFERLIPVGVNPASPGSLAYVNGGGLFQAALADFIATATNRYVGYWAAAPGLVEIESRVLRWFCDLVGLPSTSGGVLLTGGSMANLTAVVTARHERLGEDRLSAGTIYVSDQMHHSVHKAAVIAGVRARHVRLVPSDPEYRLRTDALIDMIRADRDQGLVPFCIVGNAGTTNTGAVDDLRELASIAKAHGAWFHVDACYGGFFLLTERGRRTLAGIELCDSVALDPHKSLFLPFGTGCLLVRELPCLRRAHAVHSDYVATLEEHAERVNFADLSAEQSREARGLRIWLPLKLIGADAFRRALDEKLDLAALAAEGIRSIDGLELLAAPQLSILAFRAVRPGMSAEELDGVNRRLLEIANRAGPAHLSPTVLNGRFALRICALSFRTHREMIDSCVRCLRSSVPQAFGVARN
jgi:aromatic-L-amino-acid/L-tryptophan decarboxylase